MFREVQMDVAKLKRAREIVDQLVEGIDPYKNEKIESDSFIHDERMIRCMAYISRIITENIENDGVNKSKKVEFFITSEEVEVIKSPPVPFNISSFAKSVMNSIEAGNRKRLSGAQLNRKLKEMGLLDEISSEGKTKTVTNDASHKCGIFTEAFTSANGFPYEKVLYNDRGKEFLLNNLAKILEYDKDDDEHVKYFDDMMKD